MEPSTKKVGHEPELGDHARDAGSPLFLRSFCNLHRRRAQELFAFRREGGMCQAAMKPDETRVGSLVIRVRHANGSKDRPWERWVQIDGARPALPSAAPPRLPRGVGLGDRSRLLAQRPEFPLGMSNMLGAASGNGVSERGPVPSAVSSGGAMAAGDGGVGGGESAAMGGDCPGLEAGDSSPSSHHPRRAAMLQISPTAATLGPSSAAASASKPGSSVVGAASVVAVASAAGGIASRPVATVGLVGTDPSKGSRAVEEVACSGTAGLGESRWKHLWSYAFPRAAPAAAETSELGLPSWWLQTLEAPAAPPADQTTMPPGMGKRGKVKGKRVVVAHTRSTGSGNWNNIGGSAMQAQQVPTPPVLGSRGFSDQSSPKTHNRGGFGAGAVSTGTSAPKDVRSIFHGGGTQKALDELSMIDDGLSPVSSGGSSRGRPGHFRARSVM